MLLLCGTLLAMDDGQRPDNGQLQPQSHNCSTWTYFDNVTHSCVCGAIIRFCMTQNKEQTKVVVGPCPYNEREHKGSQYIPVPSDATKLDGTVCGYTYRTGQMCGQCVNGYSPPVYSYYPQCVNCTSGTNNWAMYLAVSLLPTTAFFICALVFRFRATSPLLNGYILFCQLLMSPPGLRLVAYYNYERQSKLVTIICDIYSACLSIWNLDFFRMAYTPFCLHPNASMMQILSLDYITAACPIALIILTYTLVTLHFHNCRLVVWLWRPFVSCFARFQRQWDIQNSLIDSFATFFLLSYVKFLSVSFDLLMPTFSWDKSGKIQPPVLYYDGTVAYFQKEHLPYALLALAVLSVFTFFPILLLCVYPCRCFQRFLNRHHLSNLTLHTFMDTFQGSFKDGTNGTRDCRYFAGIYLAARLMLYISFGFSIINYSNSTIIAVLVVFVLLLATFQPYKESWCNGLDICFTATAIAGFSSLWIINVYTAVLEKDIGAALLIVLSPIPLVYPLCLVSYYVWKNMDRLQTSIAQISVAFFERPAAVEASTSLPQQDMSEATALLVKDSS